jgi:hypothetical protein
MERAIDVEEALAWAFGVVRIDDRIGALAAHGIDGRSPEAMRVLEEIGMPRAPGCRSASDVLAGYAVLGVSVGGGAVGVVRPRGTTADADERNAVEIHDAVLGLGEIWVEETDAGSTLWDAETIAAAGFVLHRHDGRRASGVWLDKGVDGWVRLTDPGILALVIRHARSGTRPGWGEEYGRMLKGRDVAGRFARQTDVDLWGEVVWHRTVYTVWHRALADVAARLDGRLEGWAVTGPAADAAPWERSESNGEGLETTLRSVEHNPLERRTKKCA